MGIATKTVGSGDAQIIIPGDPSSASSLASVLSIGNSTALAGLFASLVQNVPILLNPAGTYDPQKSAPGAIGVPAINTEGSKATYSAGSSGFTPVATPTDFVGLIGSATTTVRLLRVVISGFATAAISIPTTLVKRTTANTGSTPADLTDVSHDSNDAAGTAIVRTYTTTNPTTGTLAGIVRDEYLNLGVTGSAGRLEWDFTRRNDKALVLRGVAQGFFINWAAVAVPAGTKLAFDWEWTEET